MSIFFFNDTATTEIYTLSLHDALPIWSPASTCCARRRRCAPASGSSGSTRRWTKFLAVGKTWSCSAGCTISAPRSEEHTSELQSRQYLVCRLLLEKKKHNNYRTVTPAV